MPKNPNENHPLVGVVLHTSFGYDMTINDFCKVLEVSATGKTAKCRMLTKITNGQEHGYDGRGKADAGADFKGPEFRVKIRDEEHFHGSYPFIVQGNGTKKECSYKMGYWSKHTGPVYENRVD